MAKLTVKHQARNNENVTGTLEIVFQPSDSVYVDSVTVIVDGNYIIMSQDQVYLTDAKVTGDNATKFMSRLGNPHDIGSITTSMKNIPLGTIHGGNDVMFMEVTIVTCPQEDMPERFEALFDMTQFVKFMRLYEKHWNQQYRMN